MTVILVNTVHDGFGTCSSLIASQGRHRRVYPSTNTAKPTKTGLSSPEITLSAAASAPRGAFWTCKKTGHQKRIVLNAVVIPEINQTIRTTRRRSVDGVESWANLPQSAGRIQSDPDWYKEKTGGSTQ
jgi:hypothetical protein